MAALALGDKSLKRPLKHRKIVTPSYYTANRSDLNCSDTIATTLDYFTSNGIFATVMG